MGEINSNENKDITEINIIYNIQNKEYINIFGSKFVKNNKKNCKMIIDNKEYKIKEKYNIKNYHNNILKIKLKGINNITNMSYMFYRCSTLSFLPDISKWNTSNITNMNSIFYGCSTLIALSDISKWNTNNVTNMTYMFFECSSLLALPYISKWNTNKVKDMSYMFYGCSSLLSLPDISKWNTNNVTNMSFIFL